MLPEEIYSRHKRYNAYAGWRFRYSITSSDVIPNSYHGSDKDHFFFGNRSDSNIQSFQDSNASGVRSSVFYGNCRYYRTRQRLQYRLPNNNRT